MAAISDFFISFALGLLTPLTALCVLPLYPGFLAYLSNQFSEKDSKRKYALFGLIITMGVVVFMTIIGVLFTTIFQVSLTNVIGIVSPIAFIILGAISLLLIFNVDFGRFFPAFGIFRLRAKNPLSKAFLFGFFFGAIVIPCNPSFIAAFFVRATIITNPILSLMSFFFFGLGIGFPLLLFSLISVKWSRNIIRILIRNKKRINLIAGMLMLGISLYYLLFVFKIFGTF